MYQPLSKLFVKNFSAETRLQEIEDLFGQYGEIYDCKINDLGKCFAVVVYRDRDAAEKAISALNESNNLGGRLSVEFTHKRSNEGSNQRNEGNYRDQRQGDRYNNRDRGEYSRQQNDSRYDDRGYDNRGQGRYNDRSYQDGRQNNSRYENRGYDNNSRGQGRFERESGERRGEQRQQNGNYVPENQKDEYFRNGLCFNCKQSGHISRNCPQNSRGRPDGERNQDRSRSAEKKQYGGYRREKEENSYKGRRRSPSDSD